jgi:hypothetical protein
MIIRALKVSLPMYINENTKYRGELVEVSLGRRSSLPDRIEVELIKYCIKMIVRYWLSDSVKSMTFHLDILYGIELSCKKSAAKNSCRHV